MALGDFGRATCGAERKKVASRGKSWQVVASRGKSSGTWQVVARGKSWHVASHPATYNFVGWKLSTTLSTFQKYILYSTYSTHLNT